METDIALPERAVIAFPTLLDENYDFINAGLHYITSALDLNNDGWPEGAGIVEATGMGAEKLDVAVYTIRALKLNDLEEMAVSKGDVHTLLFPRDEAGTLVATTSPTAEMTLA